MITIYRVRNVPLETDECVTHRYRHALASFEKEIADPLNRRCLIELTADGWLLDHASGGWPRGCLVKPGRFSAQQRSSAT